MQRDCLKIRSLASRSGARNWAYAISVAIPAHFDSEIGFSKPLGQACTWPSGAMMRLEGTVTEGGLKGRFTRVVELDTGRFSEKRNYGVISIGAGNDGEHAWSQDVSGFAHSLNSEFAKRLARSEAWLSSNQTCARQNGALIEELASTAEGGRNFDVRRITPPDGAPIEVWYNSISGVPDRAILQYPENRLVRHYAEWRDIGAGREVAFKQVDEDIEDTSTTTFIVEHASASKARKPELFRIPAPPQDTRLLHHSTMSMVPYEDDHRTRIYVPVFINGQGPFAFELDSGGHLILAPKTVAALGLTSQGAFSSTGAGDQVSKAGYVRIKSLRIGTAEIGDQAAKVLPLSDQSNDRGSRSGRGGILGLELFERFRVSIDRTKHTVTLEAPGVTAPPRPWVALPITFDEDAPLTAGSFAGARGEFMIDTGNAGATIIEQFWADQVGVSKVFDAALPVGGNTKVVRAEVMLGSFRISDEVLSYQGSQARGSEHTRSVAAVTGEPMLSRFDLSFDYAHGRLWLKPLAVTGPVPFNRSGLNLLKVEDGSFRIASLVPQSPATEAGLQTGDIVTEVGGQPARSLSRADVLVMFQQPVGTTVAITLQNSASQPARVLALRLRDVLPDRGPAP
jgi:hypothetical protein